MKRIIDTENVNIIGAKIKEAREKSGMSQKQLSEKLQSESAEKGKMAVGLGTLGGLLLMIILW